MSWRAKMGRTPVFNGLVEAYLINEGFEYSTFNPRFRSEDAQVHKAKTLNERCLKMVHERPNNGSVTIYLTSSEGYVEVESFTGSLESTNLIDLPNVAVIGHIDTLLDMLTEFI